VPVTRRARSVAAAPAVVWRTVSDARRLAQWWPRVERVEGAGPGAFTEVLRSEKGAMVRADFRVLQRAEPELVRWAQDVAGTPFERLLASAETTVRLAPDDGGGTRVELVLAQRLRGVARFGGFLVRRAARRQLDDALEGLQRLHADEAA
jgi:uncharacterized protein YndB with AHSA1/START domain